MLYEEDMFFNVHIKQIYRSAFFHLRSIVKTKQKILSESNADKLVHGFIMLRLKYSTLIPHYPDHLKVSRKTLS